MADFGNYTSGLAGQGPIKFNGLTQVPALGQLPVPLAIADSFSRQSNTQEAATTGKDDQRPLSTEKKIGLFLKGLISPLTDPFSSCKSFVIATGVFIAHAALIGATGGAAAIPLLVLAGAAGIYHTAKALTALNQAQNTADEEKAIKKLGAGIGNIALAGLGSKPALREGSSIPSEAIDKMSLPKAVKENIKQVPQSLRVGKQALQSGNVIQNTKLYMGRQITETRDKIQTTHRQIKSQWSDKNIPWQDRVKCIASDLSRSLSITSLLGMQ